MTLSFRIREATLDDNEGLIELARRCPVRGPIHIALDRGPDYFAFVRMQGERSQVFVAETLQGRIIGSMVLVESGDDSRPETRVLRCADLRTDPQFRHTRLAAQFTEVYRQRLLDGLYSCGLVETVQVNAPPRKIQRLLGHGIEVVPEGAFEFYQIPPLLSYRPPRHLHLRPARPEDLPALAELLQSNYRGVLGAPLFTPEWLEAATQQHASFDLHHLWLAENLQGDLLACVGIWDQRALRQTLAVRYSRLMQVFIRVLSFIGLIWRVPEIPNIGRPLRFAYLRWPACRRGHEAAMRALVRGLLTEIRETGEYQFLAVGFHEGDRLKSCLRGLFRFKSRFQIYTHRVADRASLLPVTNRHGPFVDTSLI